MEAADVAFDLSTQILEKIMDLLTEDGAEDGFLRAGIAKSQERVLMFYDVLGCSMMIVPHNISQSMVVLCLFYDFAEGADGF